MSHWSWTVLGALLGGFGILFVLFCFGIAIECGRDFWRLRRLLKQQRTEQTWRGLEKLTQPEPDQRPPLSANVHVHHGRRGHWK